nr:hypothetical protein [Tanacetum cinerariifolium]
AENLLPIPSKCEVTLENEIECDMPANYNCSPVFTTFSNPLFKDNDDLDSSNDESLPDKDEELNAEIVDTIIESIPLLPIPVQNDNSQQEEIDIVTETDDVMPPSVENDDDDYDLLLEKEFLIDNSILSHESSDSNFEDNQSISRPPPEPPNDNFDLEAEVISAVMEDIDEPDEHFNPGGDILSLQTLKILITFLS